MPYRYRVTYLDEGERWMRRARNVLRDPAEATDLPLGAVIIPIERRDKNWDVEVRVALSPGSLTLLPHGLKKRANWEVGAMLMNENGTKSWEMLSVSELFRETAGDSTAILVHERKVRKLQPGRYRLRAFVRDRVANLYGGADDELELPPARRGSLVGPLLMRSETRLLPAELPLRKPQKPSQEKEMPKPQTGSLAMIERPVARGEPLEFLSWVCPRKNEVSLGSLQRYVSLYGEPIFRFDSAELQVAGDCSRVVDRLDTTPMKPGSYTYHIRWTPSPQQEPLVSERKFEVATEVAP